MNHNLIAKTLLHLWPGLPDYEAMLANRAMTHALCSYHTPFLTERLIDKIIDLNVKQQTMHNLSQSLQKLINQMPADLQTVARSYYHTYDTAHNLTAVAKQLGIAERSYYRKLDAVTNYVARHLPQLGINFFTWQNLLHQHAWIRETFTRLSRPNQRQNSSRQTAPSRQFARPLPHTTRAN